MNKNIKKYDNDDHLQSVDSLNVLVATNHLFQTGGTENYTYAIIEELLRLGHEVEYFTFQKGAISDRIEDLGVKFRSKDKYHLVIANHNTVVRELFNFGYIIQTCHGRLANLEQPSKYADLHVSVSEGIQQHLLTKHTQSTVILNGINCKRFYPTKKINSKLVSVLSLCQSEIANKLIKECCEELNIHFKKIDKSIDSIWGIENAINEVDMVIGIGRSLYDAMACGRTVISYDNRSYSDYFGDGYLNEENIMQSLKYNCCGRAINMKFNKQVLLYEISKYSISDGEYLRGLALKELNIEICVNNYIQLYYNQRNTNPTIIKGVLLNKNERINELKGIITNLEKVIITKDDELSEVLSSSSWRITAILRKMMKFARKIVN